MVCVLYCTFKLTDEIWLIKNTTEYRVELFEIFIPISFTSRKRKTFIKFSLSNSYFRYIHSMLMDFYGIDSFLYSYYRSPLGFSVKKF